MGVRAVKLSDLGKVQERLALLERYEATGLTPEGILRLMATPRWSPDLFPQPFEGLEDPPQPGGHDPAMEAALLYDDHWDQREHTGLLDEEA